MAKTNKRVSAAFTPEASKTPSYAIKEVDGDTILWSFTLFDDFAKLKLEQGDTILGCSLASHIRDLERRGWNDIFAKPKRDHPIGCEKLAKVAQDRLVTRKLDDIDSLWSFRCEGGMRVWGIKYNNIVFILWLDPHHRVYPVN
jgi:hypothetical protein